MKELARLSSLQMAALCLLPYVVFIIFALHHWHWDVSTFIVAGDDYVTRSQLAAPITVLNNSPGYDGQFYYRLALDPFTSKMTDGGILLDNPALRGSRIGYPLLAWAMSFGQPALLPWALLGLNLCGLFVIAWTAIALVRSQGFPAWYGLSVSLYPGFVLTLLRDTTEIAASCFGLLALSLAIRRRFWWAAVPACYAVITRETTLFYLAGYGLVEAFNACRLKRWSWNLVPLASPALLLALWHQFIVWRWQLPSYADTARDLGKPIAGFVRFIGSQSAQLSSLPWASEDFRTHAVFVLLALTCQVFAGLAAVVVARRRAEAGLWIPWLLYGAMFACLTTLVWIEPFAYMRAFSDFFVVSAVILALSGQDRIIKLNLAVLGVTWSITALFYVSRP